MTDRNNAEGIPGGVTRAMFRTTSLINPMLRGPMVAYGPDDENGGGGDDENADEAARGVAAALAAKEKAEKEKADEEARKKAEEEAGRTTPTDAEAKLLKEVMKNKRDAEAAKKALDEVNTKLKDFEGLDPAEIRKLLADKKEAETKEAEKRGEYDRILAQVRTEAETREKALKDEHGQTKAQLEAAQKRIDDLLIGSNFGSSKFLSDETVLTGDKARKLYGDHFEVEDGEFVAYDKPAGSKDRTPLVDGNGVKLNFEAAIEKIVKSDPDFERIARSKLRTGSGSRETTTDKSNNRDTRNPAPVGRLAIAAALKAKAAKK